MGTTLEGPFVYLTAALLSRLEATFVLAPLRTTAPSNPPTIDLVVMRPLRDPATRALVQEGKEEEAREGFVAKVWEVTKGAYSGGQHLGIVYPGGEGVVEYYRCGGFGWKPVSFSFCFSFLLWGLRADHYCWIDPERGVEGPPRVS